MVSCPQCKGNYPIIQGASNVMVMGKPIALEGMKTACGAVLISSQTLSSVDDPGWSPGTPLTRSAPTSMNNEINETLSTPPANHFASTTPISADFNDIDENSTEGVEAWLITIYSRPFGMRVPTLIGDHSALYYIAIDNAPFLFDPAGNYLIATRGASNFLTDEEANLNNYVRFHMEESKVIKTRVTLTRKQASSIVRKAINWDIVRSLYCATSISNLLHEDYNTPEQNGITKPSTLESDVRKIEARIRKNQE